MPTRQCSEWRRADAIGNLERIGPPPSLTLFVGRQPRHMFSTWTKRKKMVAALSVPFVGFIIFFAIIVIDGEGYDRWKNVRELRYMREAWIRDGSPDPPDAMRYAGQSASRTSFVYTASHVIGGQSYTGVFAHRSYPRFGTWVIARNGEIIVVDDHGGARLAKIHKTRAAAW